MSTRSIFRIQCVLFGGETFAMYVPSSVFGFWGALTSFELRPWAIWNSGICFTCLRGLQTANKEAHLTSQHIWFQWLQLWFGRFVRLFYMYPWSTCFKYSGCCAFWKHSSYIQVLGAIIRPRSPECLVQFAPPSSIVVGELPCQLVLNVKFEMGDLARPSKFEFRGKKVSASRGQRSETSLCFTHSDNTCFMTGISYHAQLCVWGLLSAWSTLPSSSLYFCWGVALTAFSRSEI